MLGNLSVLTARELKIAFRNHFFSIIILLAVIYLAAIFFVIPEEVVLDPQVFYSDLTGEGVVKKALADFRGSITELKSEAELKALQAQINPHFLFNSLNAVAATCRTKPKQARELLIKLAGIFRRTLKRDVYQITLAEEIDFCKDYLSIEKARLDKRLEVKWEIPFDLKDIIIPPFIIQPLIENSIKHGIYPQEKGGKIIISAQKIADKLQITIEDNGRGISREKISEIEKGYNDRIGINNIQERLNSVYGNSAEFIIEPKTNQGTRNIINIPSEFLFERRKAN